MAPLLNRKTLSRLTRKSREGEAQLERKETLTESENNRAAVERAQTAEDDLAEISHYAEGFEVLLAEAKELVARAGDEVNLEKTKEVLEQILSDRERVLEIFGNQDNASLVEKVKSSPDFLDKFLSSAQEAIAESTTIEEIVQQGDNAREHALTEVQGGLGGKIIAKIESNPQLAIGCALAGVASLMILARKDKGVGSWFSGVAMGGLSTYLGLSLFGKTDEARRFFEEKLNDLIEDPTGKGRELAKSLKSGFDLGMEKVFGEENVAEVIDKIVPLVADIPQLAWINDYLKVRKLKEGGLRGGIESGKAAIGSLIGKVGNGQESISPSLNQELDDENLSGQESVLPENRAGFGAQGREEAVDRSLETTTADRETAEVISRKTGREISAKEVAITRALPISDETQKIIAECIETGQAEDRERAYDSFFKNELSSLIITGGKNVLFGILAGAVSLEKILLIKHFLATKEVISGYSSADEGYRVARAGRKYLTGAAGFSVAFGSRELMRKFIFGSGRGFWEMARVTAKESALWPYYGVKSVKDLTVGVYKGGKYVINKGATKLLIGSFGEAMAKANKVKKLAHKIDVQKLAKKFPKLKTLKLTPGSARISTALKSGRYLGKFMGGLAGTAMDWMFADSVASSEQERASFALSELERNLSLLDIGEEKLNGDWSLLNADEKKLVVQAIERANQSASEFLRRNEEEEEATATNKKETPRSVLEVPVILKQ